jgi:flagellar basal-body rod protein FlgF
MADVLSIASLAMSNDMVRLDALSHNLANISTTAYRREVVYERPFADLLASTGANAPLAIPLPDPQIAIDPQQGTVRSTGVPLDVALQSANSWFELIGPNGPVYTRRGDFKLDDRGRLVSQDGWVVIGTTGGITLQGNAAVRIDQQGRVFEGSRPAGQLRVVRFARPSELQDLGNGLFSAPTQAAATVDSPQVRQGYLENSNVNSVNEMVQMIETMRRFETNQRLIQNYDDSLGRAIRTLGNF